MSINSSETSSLRIVSKTIDAGYYNRVRLGLLRLGDPLRIELPELHVEVVFRDQHWACISKETQSPLLLWTDFNGRRDALFAPVACTLHLYHVHAGLLAAIALEATHDILRQRLNARRHYSTNGVVAGNFRRSA